MNAALVNFAAGESSPRSRGRFDIPSYPSSCRKMLNFMAEVAGPARYRTGFKHVAQTRGGAVARRIPFQLNDSQAYMLEFTPGYMRVYKDGELVTVARTTVTGITQAATAVITVASTTGLSVGDEVIITGIVGMVELNGRQVKLGTNVGSTYQLLDPVTGVGIDSTTFTAWSSGGVLREVYEIASPYLEGELDDISYAQNRNTMYLAHYLYAPRKLTVDGLEAWTLTTYARTANPFASTSPVLTITSLTSTNETSGSYVAGQQTKVTFSSYVGISEDIKYDFAAVVGMVNVNGVGYYLVPAPSPFSGWYLSLTRGGTGLADFAAGGVDSSSWPAYVSGGTATPPEDNPIAVAFYEGRLGFFGTNQRPNTFFLSRSPVPTTGASRYDDFTGGVDADHACFFTLAPASGQVDYFAWATGTAKHLIAGTFGGPFRISGGGLDEPITPSSINVRQIDPTGCEAVAPARGARVFFIQRGGGTLRTVRFNADIDEQESYDMCLNAEHIGHSRLTRVVLQTGRPDVVWVLRDDGILAGMTVQGNENIAGWHRQKIAGTDAKVIDVAVLPRPDQNDQLWVGTERTVNGITRRFTEIWADDVAFPDLEDFYLGPSSINKENDLEAFQNAVYRRQEEYIHLDAAATYNGSDRGYDADATLTPGAITGEGIAFTASAAVFAAADVGKELWKKPNRETGIGGGRALITAFVSTTEVTCEILVDFDHAGAIDAGEWHFAVTEITNLWHLEGAHVGVVIDGAVYSDGNGDFDYPLVTVANGKITLSGVKAAVAHVGLPYAGILQPQNLEAGGRSGPAQAKPRNIREMNVRFLATLGAEYGTDLYRMEQINFRAGDATSDRPEPVFSGIKKLPYTDQWSAQEEKFATIVQRLPLPCVVQAIDISFDIADE